MHLTVNSLIRILSKGRSDEWNIQLEFQPENSPEVARAHALLASIADIPFRRRMRQQCLQT